MRNERIDVLVVKQGLAESREKAQALILAGKILSGDRLFDKPGRRIPEDTPLRVRGETDPYVSRAARKLIGALDAFKVELAGTVCLDVGASTGGFTQVCLERGASKVYAVDVGHNQLHWKIRNDARVVSLEGVNMRAPADDLLPEKASFVCIDTSFISLKLILPSVKKFLSKRGEIVALIKPQHEVGREEVGKGGVVRDPALHERATSGIAAFAQSIGFEVAGLVESSLVGTAGNKEFLIHLRWSASES
ncbi:MAG: TlyA family RNA methyltransferase [Deltaproteobacteria bacterium]|nr:TlyA family RNA methyltransferase [Deltaproteobacteria bacterium]